VFDPSKLSVATNCFEEFVNKKHHQYNSHVTLCDDYSECAASCAYELQFKDLNPCKSAENAQDCIEAGLEKFADCVRDPCRKKYHVVEITSIDFLTCVSVCDEEEEERHDQCNLMNTHSPSLAPSCRKIKDRLWNQCVDSCRTVYA
ncbi:hypothetical protein BGZ72_000920, partial [Mortierella alpina]